MRCMGQTGESMMCCEDMLDRGRGRERQAISEAVTTASTEDVLLRPPAFPDAPRTLATDSLIGINSSIRHPHMPRPWHPIRALCATKCEKLSDSGSVAGRAGSGRRPTDRHGGSDTADIAGADLSSATYGCKIDTFRR